MAIHEMEMLGKSTINLGNPTFQWQAMTNNPRALAMHAKTSEENIHPTWYLQEKSTVVVDLDVLLHFLTLPFPSCFETPSMKNPPRVLQDKSKCQRVWERE